MECLVSLACRLAAPYGADGGVVVVSVVEVPVQLDISEGLKFVSQREAVLHAAQRVGREHGMRLRTEVRVAHKTGQAILQMAKLEHADLLILGWRGYTTTREAVFGSVVDTVIDYAPCDLLVVKYEPEPKLPFGNILLPTAGGPSAKFAARLAGHLLEEGGVLTLAGVARKGADEEAMARSRQGVADTIADVPFAVDTERKLLTGASVAAAVLKESRANAYDVIIVGATKVSLLKRAMFGQIPERIAHLSLTPVILAKHHEGARTWLSRFLGK